MLRVLHISDLHARVAWAERNARVPFLTTGLCAGALYVSAILVSAALRTPVSPRDVMLDGAAVMGVVGALVAVTALGYAIRTDSGVAALKKEKEEVAHALSTVDVVDKRELATEPGTPPEDTTPVTPPKATIAVDGVDYDLMAPDDLPTRVRNDLLVLGSEKTGEPMRNVGERLKYAARARGEGNAPWLFGLDDQELWRLSYPGRASAQADLRILGVASEQPTARRRQRRQDKRVRGVLIKVASEGLPLSDAIDRARRLGVSRSEVERVACESRASKLIQFSDPLQDATEIKLT